MSQLQLPITLCNTVVIQVQLGWPVLLILLKANQWACLATGTMYMVIIVLYCELRECANNMDNGMTEIIVQRRVF